MGDMIKASGHLDLDNKPFHSGFGAPMGKSNPFQKFGALPISSLFILRLRKLVGNCRHEYI